jgi:hypothetical protein
MQFEDGFTFLDAPTLHGIFFIFEAIQTIPHLELSSLIFSNRHMASTKPLQIVNTLFVSIWENKLKIKKGFNMP